VSVTKPRLGETIRSNRDASRTVRSSKKKRHQPREKWLLPILGRANCHTAAADRHTALCTCHPKRERSAEMTTTTWRLGSATQRTGLCRTECGAKPFLVGKLFLNQFSIPEAAPKGPVAATGTAMPGKFPIPNRGWAISTLVCSRRRTCVRREQTVGSISVDSHSYWRASSVFTTVQG
jgi:hypothetical protein